MRIRLVVATFMTFVSLFLTKAKCFGADSLKLRQNQESIQPKPWVEVSGTLIHQYFSSMGTPDSGKKQNFSETIPIVNLGFQNKSSIYFLTEYDMYFNKPGDNDFWISELRYSLFPISMYKARYLETVWNNSAGIVLPTSKYASKNLSMDGGIVYDTNVTIATQKQIINQTYKFDFEVYKFFTEFDKTYDDVTGDYTGSPVFQAEIHELIQTKFEWQNWFSIVYLKHYDFFDNFGEQKSYFRHLESIGYKFSPRFTGEFGHVLRGNLVGVNNWSNALPIYNSNMSLAFFRLILSF